MSGLTRRLLNGQNLPAVADKRRAHQKTWSQMLTWARPYEHIFSPISCDKMSTIPYLASFKGESETEAEWFFDFLQRCELPVTNWPDLPPEVLNNPNRHSASIDLRYRGFFLPVHQTLSVSDITACGKQLLDASTVNWQVHQINRQEWDTHWPNCSMTNLLQSWEYGAAKEQVEGWKAYRIMVSDKEGIPIGLAQLLTRGLPILGSVARLNRGPILLGDFRSGSEEPLKLAVLRVIMREARRQLWWVLQIAPELPATDEANRGLRTFGFKRLDVPAWASARLSLKLDEQDLLMGLKGKWRNTMRKGLKLGVNISRRLARGADLEVLIQKYLQLQQEREFSGLTEPLIRSLAAQPESTFWKFNLFVAHGPHSSPLGLLVSIRSGDTSTYLIGITNDHGRQMQANSVLLWNAILQAKSDGCVWFDIGGLNEATPQGITEFKRGINASPYKLAGEWRNILVPWT